MTLLAEHQRVSTEGKHNVRPKRPAVDHRVLIANRLAAEMLAEEAARGNSRVFKWLAYSVGFILSLIFWWVALKLALRL